MVAFGELINSKCIKLLELNCARDLHKSTNSILNYLVFEKLVIKEEIKRGRNKEIAG